MLDLGSGACGFGVDAMGVFDGCKEGPGGCELLTGIETGKKRDQRWLMASGMRKESRGRWHVNSDLRMTCEI